jgi:hypothetical protein
LAPVAGAATSSPAVSVNPIAAPPGDTVIVRGEELPPSTNVQVQICGNGAVDGSTDCDLATSQEVSTTSQGHFSLSLVVAVPPKPCPCVVMVLDLSSGVAPTTPITVIGAQLGAGQTPVKIRPLEVVREKIEGTGPWTSWFGASPQRKLILTVHNPNDNIYASPPLVLAIGQNSDTTTHEATNQRLATIGPYGTRRYVIPVGFPAFSIGTHQVSGVLGDAGYTTRFEVRSHFFPWGLPFVALVLVVLIAWALVFAFRAILRRRYEPDGTPIAMEDAVPVG